MKRRAAFIVVVLCLWASQALAIDDVFLRVKTEDGATDVNAVTEIKVGNGSLTDNGSGSVSITTSGGSGDVTGPSTNTDGYIPLWDGANSKKLKNGIADNHSNWDTAYGWGNHASAGYLTGIVADSPLSGAGTPGSHLTVDLSGKQNASSSLTSLAGLNYSADAFVKMTGANTFSLSTTAYEPALGNPDVDGKVLSSTAAGVRSWITAGGDLTGYVKNDGTNLPFTADVTIDKTTPEVKLLSNDDSDSYGRLTRTGRVLTVKNQVTVPSAAGYAIGGWNGSSRSIPVPSMASFSDAQDHTFAAWIYLTSWGSNVCIIICTGQGSSKGPALGFDSSGKINWWSSDSNWWAGNTAIPKNQWNLVAATFTASTDTITFYLNGVADGTATSNAFSAGTTGQCLGSRTDGNFWLPSGTVLDSCYIWNRVLSAAELLGVYNGGVGVYEDTGASPFNSGLVEGWRFDENTGTTAASFASGGHNTGNFDAGLTWAAGISPASASTTTEEATLLSSTTGVTASEQGRLTVGHSTGRTVLNGKDLSFAVAGTEVGRFTTAGNLAFATGKMIQPLTDAVTAFGIATAAGTRIFNFDTTNTRFGIGNSAPTASLSLPASQTTAAYGIDFGGDVTLYRSAANVLKTDDAFSAVSLTGTGLTSGRVPYATTGGLLTDGAGFLFNGNQFQVSTSYAGSIAVLRRTTTATAQTIGVVNIVSKTSNNMSDGFGGGFGFYIADNTAGDTFIGEVTGERDGADNSGAFKIFTVKAGTRNAAGITLDSDNNMEIASHTTIGAGAAGVDYTLTCNGESNDGILTWMEDEDYFQFSDDIKLSDNETIVLGGTGFVDSPGYKASGVAGIDTTFVDADGNTITVTKGIITAKTAP